jgi:probable rRNA maturation factor
MITIEPSFEATLSASTLTRFLNRARLAIGLRGAVDVLLANDSTLRQLNKNFRGKDKPTDVLSFPAPTAFAKKHAGDLAVSLETAARQAKTYGHTLPDEVKILLLHGLLHLAGEDHETDNGEMATREATLRRELRLPTTLIERTARTTTKKHLATIERPQTTTIKSSSGRKKPPSEAQKPFSIGRKQPHSNPKLSQSAKKLSQLTSSKKLTRSKKRGSK